MSSFSRWVSWGIVSILRNLYFFPHYESSLSTNIQNNRGKSLLTNLLAVTTVSRAREMMAVVLTLFMSGCSTSQSSDVNWGLDQQTVKTGVTPTQWQPVSKNRGCVSKYTNTIYNSENWLIIYITLHYFCFIFYLLMEKKIFKNIYLNLLVLLVLLSSEKLLALWLRV